MAPFIDTPKERRKKVAHKPRPLKVVFGGKKGR